MKISLSRGGDTLGSSAAPREVRHLASDLRDRGDCATH
jgi:hypothetical protein